MACREMGRKEFEHGIPKSWSEKKEKFRVFDKASYIKVAKYQKVVSLWSQPQKPSKPQNTFRDQATFMQIPDELSLGYRFHKFF